MLRTFKRDPVNHLERLTVAAEGEGFEPSMAFAMPVFKTGAIGHSATPPGKAILTDTLRRGRVLGDCLSQMPSKHLSHFSTQLRRLQFAQRFRDHAHDGLGVTAADVHPAVGPVQPQAV